MEQHQTAEPLVEGAVRSVILVVEDEFLARILEVDILRDAGFRVVEAQTLTRLLRCSAEGRKLLLS